jgi:hypothetical protein
MILTSVLIINDIQKGDRANSDGVISKIVIGDFEDKDAAIVAGSQEQKY